MLNKKAKEMELVKYAKVSLAEARMRHFASLIKVADGIDPIEMKKKAAKLAKRGNSILLSD